MTTPVRERYDAMWNDALPTIRACSVECDTRLLQGYDSRRGLTLVARPGRVLAAGLAAVLDRLGAIEPGQYRHPAADLHLTVLSLFTVTDDYAPHLARLPEYREAVRAGPVSKRCATACATNCARAGWMRHWTSATVS